MKPSSVRAALFFAALLAAFSAPRPLSAQDREAPAPSSVTLRIDHGPGAPVAPATMTRDDQGNATVRAVRISDPIRMDGRLDEAIYSELQPLTGFLQTLPDEGAPATERTEAWITFDDENVYVSARLYDSAPPSEWVANEMRRDTNQLRNNDTFAVSFDTYYDHRNALFFYTNPLGARADIQHTNEGNPNGDWNPIWDVRTGRFEGGWTVEMEFPFKSLRYRPGREQVWGLQLRRAIRRKNEWVHLTQIPRTAVTGNSGASAVMRVSRHATLVGIEAPEAGRNLEIKPYAITGLETDRAADISNDGHADAGLDVKLGLTENLTADLTVNTDFAQVEADEQQVNLTRFELSFPEKREFFLEGRDIYQFALGAGGGDTPTLFFSRRIGLDDGELVPIRVGGRLTGKLGAFDVGAMNIQTGGEDALGIESNNFTVLRLRRDVFRRSTVGALFTNRSVSAAAPDGSNQTFGVDANFAFRQDLNFVGFLAKTSTPGLTTDDRSYLGSFNYNGDLLGLGLGHLRVGENFNPEVGFLRRSAFRESTVTARISPRPASIQSVIRRLSLQGSFDYLEHDAATRFLESRESSARFQIEFQSSDVVDFSWFNSYEFLERPFRISGGGGIAVPAGEYTFDDFGASLGLGLQRWYSGSVAFNRGSFYTGDKTTVALRTGRINVSTRLSLEPTLSFNWIDLPQGSFRSDLAVTRVNYAFTPRMFFGGLVQYNSGSRSISSNLRLRWEYRPGSELFVVYTEARNTDLADRFSELANRGLTVKLNYLLRR